DGKAVTDNRFADLKGDGDRKEWLYQAIESMGDPHNYRADPNLEVPDLWEIYEDLLEGGEAHAPPKAPDINIHTGMTKALEYHKATPKLTRTDSTTLGLDGATPDAHDDHEFGEPVGRKLTRTDHTTIGLDGRPVSPPQAMASHHNTAANHSTKPGNPKPKRAIVPRSRIEEIRQETKARQAQETKGSAVPDPVKKAPAPSHSKPSPQHVDVPDVEMAEPSEEEEGDADNDGEEGEADELKVSNKRDSTLIQKFGLFATPLVKHVLVHLRIEMAAVCGYPEHVKSDEDPSWTYLDIWIAKHWAAANAKHRPDLRLLPINDQHVSHIQKQISPARNSVKKCCDPVIGPFFELYRKDPNHAAKAHDLTKDDKWLSPNLCNDDAIFMHPIIVHVLVHTFFRSSKSVAPKNLDRFTPLIPLGSIAYVCTIIRHLIDAYEVSGDKSSDLHGATNAATFRMYMRKLKKIGEENEGALFNLRTHITKECLKSRGKLSDLPPMKLNLGPQQPVNMAAVEELKGLLGGAAPDFKDWDGLPKKGKDRADAPGPSRVGH
ncbi:hypothetical protein FS749_012685, partial [Ceratobasidium sp. UAMH 11750]